MVRMAAMDDRASNARISSDGAMGDRAIDDRAIDVERATRLNRCR